GTDLSDGTGVVNRWIADLIRSAYADGRPYPAEFLATDINSSLLADRWRRDETRTLPEDKLNVVILMSRRAARHVLGLWREGKRPRRSTGGSRSTAARRSSATSSSRSRRRGRPATCTPSSPRSRRSGTSRRTS